MIRINVIQRGFGPVFHGDQTQQDKSVIEQIRSTPRTVKQILANQQAKPTILVSPDMGPFSCIFSTLKFNFPYIGAHPFGFIVAADLPIT
jgi:hypothetical protein